jgi:hypothetical protein
MKDSEDPGDHKLPVRKHEAIVYICNLSEDVWPFISAMSDPAAKITEIRENASLSDRDLFTMAGEDHVLIITPKPVSRPFLEYFRGLTGKRDFEIVTTKTHSGEICRDIREDPEVMVKIEEAANSSRKLTLLAYTTSHQFLKLAGELKQRGLTLNTPEAPNEEDAWAVNFYGSKSGIRQLAQQSHNEEPDFVMPDGIICVNIADAARISANWYLKNQGVVLKTNKGHSGAGLMIYRPGDLPLEYSACEKKILTQLQKDAYWDMFPIVIEDYITPAQTIGGGFPNAEFKVLRNGHVEFLYYCGLRVTKDGIFRGVEIHDDVLSDKIAAQIMDTGFYIGEKYAEAGYAGYFDVDYVAAKNGRLYITESNVRRTGGTHVYHTAERLFGRDFMHDTFTLSNNSYALKPDSQLTFEKLYDKIRPVLFNKKNREGVVIVSENVLSHDQLAYIVFGKTRRRALEIEGEMELLVNR